MVCPQPPGQILVFYRGKFIKNGHNNGLAHTKYPFEVALEYIND